METRNVVDVAVVGGGPAGICAALEAAGCGAAVLLLDENERIGGQLFKQVHKFFGSQRHMAGRRGFDIALELLGELDKKNVRVELNSAVYALFPGNILGISKNGASYLLPAKRIILATGASEIAVPFPGWTLPGVMGAGAVQTLMNLYRVLPGRRFLMVGAGNVGLIVSYQLLQAGAEVAAIVEARPRISGYDVHAAKVKRAGVPLLTETTVLEACGRRGVESARIGRLGQDGRIIRGSERDIEVDAICVSVGLQPSIELSQLAGCKLELNEELGGYIPVRTGLMETTVKGLYVAGDLSGVGEASAAMEEGRLAGMSAARSLGYPVENFEGRQAAIAKNLAVLASRDFASNGAAGKGGDKENPPADFELRIECFETIPCNPCETACKRGAITVGTPITNLPRLNAEKCSKCLQCIAACPGQAISLLDYTWSDDSALIILPYEFFPLPQEDEIVKGMNKEGEVIGEGVVKRVRSRKGYDKTALVEAVFPKKIIRDVYALMRTYE